MTGTSARNIYGIFKTKRARNLAIEYNLDIHNKKAYIHDKKHISYDDVLFIVQNLWDAHFSYGSDKPIDVSIDEYNKLRIIYNS
jgi:hypothetical protein